jgi:hypothetical protein
MTSAAAQYREWCYYLFEYGKPGNGTVRNKGGTQQVIKKYIFGLPLRFKGRHMLTTESPTILERSKQQIVRLIQDFSSVHKAVLDKKQDCELLLGRDNAKVTFMNQHEVTVSIMIASSCTLTEVHTATLLFSVYLYWLLSKKNLLLVEWTITFSVVFTTEEEEVHIRQQLLADTEWCSTERERQDFLVAPKIVRRTWDDEVMVERGIPF